MPSPSPEIIQMPSVFSVAFTAPTFAVEIVSIISVEKVPGTTFYLMPNLPDNWLCTNENMSATWSYPLTAPIVNPATRRSRKKL